MQKKSSQRERERERVLKAVWAPNLLRELQHGAVLEHVANPSLQGSKTESKKYGRGKQIQYAVIDLVIH